MVSSFKARQMVPGKDTIGVMAMHYGLKPSQVRDIIMQAGVQVIREDGFKSALATAKKQIVPGARKTSVVVWSDGVEGVDPATTKLTKEAIMTVAKWKHEHDEDVAA